jgi:transcriptional regulator with XRE-family HTH domain
VNIALRGFNILDYAGQSEDSAFFFIEKAFDTISQEMAIQALYRPLGSGSVRSLRSTPFTRFSADPWLENIISYETQPDGCLRQDEVEGALGYIKNTLSLNVSELAEVMGVTRPTVYAWAEGGNADEPNRQRLAALKELAQEWESLCSEPLGALVRDRSEGGTRILDLIKAPELPVAEIKETFKLFAGVIETRKASQKVDGLSFRELAQRHGLQQLGEDKYRMSVKTAARSSRR